MWLLAVDQALGTTGFYHPSRVWRDQMAFRVAICSCGKERMPFLAPIPRQQFALADILVACRWSHHPRTRAWMSRSAMSIRHDIDYMDEVNIHHNSQE
ncbi:hypothetical protein AHAS_Ahas16G0031000 [Arachis hypogaea]